MHKSPPCSYQQPQPEARQALASLIQQGYGDRHIARVLVRSPATVSRELRSNAHALAYASMLAAHTACLHRRRMATPPKKLHADGLLFGAVHHFLGLRCSPEQIAPTLARIHPKGHERRVSHESIYNCIYAQPEGELKRELIAALRHARNKQVPRYKRQDRRGQIPEMLCVHQRPPEIEDRQFPCH